MTSANGFFEEDEPVEDVKYAFDRTSDAGVVWITPVRFTYSTSVNVKLSWLKGAE